MSLFKFKNLLILAVLSLLISCDFKRPQDEISTENFTKEFHFEKFGEREKEIDPEYLIYSDAKVGDQIKITFNNIINEAICNKNGIKSI